MTNINNVAGVQKFATSWEKATPEEQTVKKDFNVFDNMRREPINATAYREYALTKEILMKEKELQLLERQLNVVKQAELPKEIPSVFVLPNINKKEDDKSKGLLQETLDIPKKIFSSIFG